MTDKEKYLNLIVRYLDNPQNKQLHFAITAFRAGSATNEAYFREVERIWLFSSRAATLNLLDVGRAEHNFRSALTSKPSPILKLAKWIGGIAATLTVIGLTFFNLTQRVETRTAKTGKNQIDTILLADGSKVILGENSEFSFPSKFSSPTRDVTLNGGKAFFLIAKDTKHAFRVNMGASRVSVLGTSFNIAFSKTNIELDVKTGRVMFRPNKKVVSSILSAGQGLSYNIRKNELVARLSQNSDSWITKELSFVDTPLEEVCRQLSDCYGVQITFKEGKKANKRFNATFKNEDLKDIINVLKHTYNLTFKYDGAQLTLKTP